MSDSKFEPKDEINKSSSSQRDSEEEKDQVPENIEGNSQQFTHPKANPQAILNSQTQQVIMEIIQSLKGYNSPAASEQLFKTLTETSQAIKKMPADASGSDEEQEDIKSKKSSMSVESQLKLLLEKLNANGMSTKSKEPGEDKPEASSKSSFSHQMNSNGAPTTGHSHQRITDAYKLINEVIMIPQIMWTRNFFYSLGAMSPEQQSIVHGWFQEMNEKQQIYIKEIERANDQLKQTSQELFSEKSLSREQADLFLKKVNFMENREYFFHKRKAMTKENGQFEDQPVPTENQSVLNCPSQKITQTRLANQSSDRFFYDKMSTSCNLEDDREQDPDTAQNSRYQKQRFAQNREQGFQYGHRQRFYHQNGGERYQNYRKY